MNKWTNDFKKKKNKRKVVNEAGCEQSGQPGAGMPRAEQKGFGDTSHELRMLVL